MTTLLRSCPVGLTFEDPRVPDKAGFGHKRDTADGAIGRRVADVSVGSKSLVLTPLLLITSAFRPLHRGPCLLYGLQNQLEKWPLVQSYKCRCLHGPVWSTGQSRDYAVMSRNIR